MSERKFDNFDEFADNYTDILNDNIKISGTDSSFFSEYKVAEVSGIESNNTVKNILDLGCGTGNSSAFFSKYFPNSVIHGVDVSEDSIKVAEKRDLKNVHFQAYNGLELPFEDKHFDIVFVAMVFHHIEHHLHAQLLEDVFRVLKPEGRFYNFEHNPYNPLTRKAVNECAFDEDAVLLYPKYAKKITKTAGFQSVELNYTIFVPRFPVLKKLAFIENYLKWLPLGAQYYTKAVK